MIPNQQWEQMFSIVFTLIAARRGPHWKLQHIPAQANPMGTGEINEAALLAESFGNVMKYVPLPTRELGIIGDLSTCAFAFYSVVNARLQMDTMLKDPRAVAALRREAERVVAVDRDGSAEMRVQHERPHVQPDVERPPAVTVLPADGGEVTAADVMEQLTEAHEVPLAAVTSPLAARGERQLSGDPYADGVQLGHAPTLLLAPNEDPEPVLLEAFRPGERAATIAELVEANGDGNVLDRLAPPIEVEGQPASREIGAG